MKKWLAGLVLGMSLMIGSVAWAQPEVPPAPTSGSLYVQDYAGVLSNNTKNKIDTLGAELRDKTKAHVLVVTVKSLDGNAIADYALAILRQWGVGDKNLNNGVVILISTEDRKSSIRTGYGLEGALPDGKVGRIQDDYMRPFLQKGDFDGGVLNSYQAVIGEVAKEYNVTINTERKPVARVQTGHSLWNNLPWWVHLAVLGVLVILVLIDWLFFGGMFTLLLLSLFRGGGGGGGSSGGSGGGFGGGSGGGGGADRDW